MTERLETCISCGEEFDSDSEGRWTDKGPLCTSCWEYDEEYASTLVHASVRGMETIRFSCLICGRTFWGLAEAIAHERAGVPCCSMPRFVKCD